MVPELPGRETAIRTLVAALDGAVLARSFPGLAPAGVRPLVTAGTAPAAPARACSCSPRRLTRTVSPSGKVKNSRPSSGLISAS